MKRSFAYHPTYFFIIVLLITHVTWLTASYVSYQPSLQYLLFPLILVGMSSPTISALIMLANSRDKRLWSDFRQRFHFNRVKVRYLPAALFLMPCLVLLAIAISLLFGLSTDQFSWSHASPDQVLEGKNLLTIAAIVLFSCSLEEIGWRGYGIDSLNNRFSLWWTSLIFAAIWSLWHVPAFFIRNGYFQQEVWNLGAIQVINYFVSLFPVTIILNWLYAKNTRSIVIVILSHAALNLSYGLFPVQPLTKVILTLLLLVSAGIIVGREKALFFKRAVVLNS